MITSMRQYLLIFVHLKELWDPRFSKSIPFTIPTILSCERNSILKRNTFPSIFHEITNILMRVAIRIGEDFSVVLSPQFEGSVLIKIGECSIAEQFCRAFVFSLLIDDISVFEFNKSHFIELVDDLHNVFEFEIVCVHFYVGVEDFTFVGDGFSGGSNLVQHSGGFGILDGATQGCGSIPAKSQLVGFIRLGSNGIERRHITRRRRGF
mmetsp:Transcript_13233/g.23801  ORF Transcript_13233/g.23801 Transcript_13233/m.23801 type:complete len:208 (+) Transcript_13233:23-646(+)